MTFIQSHYNTIDQVPIDMWDQLANQNVCLRSSYLKSLENSKMNNMMPHYIHVSNNKTEAIAYFFIMDFDVSAMSNDIAFDTRHIVKTWFPQFGTLKMTECGFLAGLGEAFSFQSRSDITTILPSIMNHIITIANENQSDIILIRDIAYQHYHQYYNILKEFGFIPFLGFPTTKLSLSWSSLDDYFIGLKKDRRKEFRRHQAKFDKQAVSIDIIEDFGYLSDQLLSLLNQVTKGKSEYQHETLNAKFFREINETLVKNSYILVMKAHNEILLFALCIEKKDEIIAMYVGFNTDLNNDYDLYFNHHFYLIEQALKRRKKSIDFGITSYNFKLLLGCELHPYIYFMKHLKGDRYARAIVKMLEDSIQLPENNHRTFRNQDLSKRIPLSMLKKEIKSAVSQEKNDIFAKAYQYTRADITKLFDLYSFFPVFDGPQEHISQKKNQSVVMLGSNSYLGLSTHPSMLQSAKKSLDIYGTGCTGSPFLNGTMDIHVDLAQSLAKFMKKEEALLFSTGYMTNLGICSAIAGKEDLLIIDKLDHASIYDGGKFSYGTVKRFRHNDMNSLESVLKRYRDNSKLIIVDSVFSMEGTICDLPNIVSLAKKYHARIFLDEAHAIGVLGSGGRGVAEHFNLIDQVDLIMGTFSKSFSAMGGFVAGDSKIIDYLRHVSRPHMFTASLAPSIIGTVRQALNIIQNEPERRERVLRNAEYMAVQLQGMGYMTKFQGTAIVPIYCGDELITLAIFKKLFDEGVYTNPVLSPAVPRGQELLRTSYMATHTQEDMDRALDLFDKVRMIGFPKKDTISFANMMIGSVS